MRILLFSMPDSFEHTPTLAVRMPNGALASLAGNVDDHHHVAIADLILAQDSVRATVERLVREQQPDLVGLSVVPARHRAQGHLARPIDSPVGAYRHRRLRPVVSA
jgi:hypothetical protein